MVFGILEWGMEQVSLIFFFVKSNTSFFLSTEGLFLGGFVSFPAVDASSRCLYPSRISLICASLHSADADWASSVLGHVRSTAHMLSGLTSLQVHRHHTTSGDCECFERHVCTGWHGSLKGEPTQAQRFLGEMIFEDKTLRWKSEELGTFQCMHIDLDYFLFE